MKKQAMTKKTFKIYDRFIDKQDGTIWEIIGVHKGYDTEQAVYAVDILDAERPQPLLRDYEGMLVFWPEARYDFVEYNEKDND